MVEEAPIPRNGEARPHRMVKKLMLKEWKTPLGLPRVPSVETTYSGTRKNEVLRCYKMNGFFCLFLDAAGRDVFRV